MTPVYLGDGLYAKFNKAQQLEVFAHDGREALNTIYFEVEVFNALLLLIRHSEWGKQTDVGAA